MSNKQMVRGIANQNINLRIKEERKRANISVPHLAEKLELKESSVYRMDTGSAIPSTEKIVKIAEILNTNVCYLLGFTNVRTANERYIVDLRLQDLREEVGLSRPALASDTDIPNVNFAGWESGKTMIRLDSGILLSNYFGCSLDYFLGLTDQVVWVEERYYIAGQPVQIVQFDKGMKVIRWGIVNDSEDGILLSDGTVMECSYQTIKKHFESEVRENIACPVIGSGKA